MKRLGQDISAMSVQELLAQYPPLSDIGKIWTMNVHIQMCPECTFLLQLQPGQTFDPAPLEDLLGDNTRGASQEDLTNLKKWARLGTPDQVRRIQEVLMNCHNYEPVTAPPPRRGQPVERTPRQPIERTSKQPIERTSDRAFDRPSMRQQLGDALLGPRDSKYYLQRPERPISRPTTQSTERTTVRPTNPSSKRTEVTRETIDKYKHISYDSKAKKDESDEDVPESDWF